MLELSENDGSIVLSAGSMLAAAEVIKAWQEREFRIEENLKQITSTK